MTRRSAVLTGATAIVVASFLAVVPSAAAFTTRDMLGRDVTLAAPPRRIVSLVPSVTEILYALQAEWYREPASTATQEVADGAL